MIEPGRNCRVGSFLSEPSLSPDSDRPLFGCEILDYFYTEVVMRGADATVLVNVMLIPCFGRRITIGRASIV